MNSGWCLSIHPFARRSECEARWLAERPFPTKTCGYFIGSLANPFVLKCISVFFEACFGSPKLLRHYQSGLHFLNPWHHAMAPPKKVFGPPKKTTKKHRTSKRGFDILLNGWTWIFFFFWGGGGVDILLGVNSARLRIWMSIYRAISSPIKSQGFQQPKYVSLNQCPSLNCAREKLFLIKENRHRTSEFLVGSLFCGCHVAYSLMLKCLFMLGIPSHLKHSRSFVFVSEAVKLVGVCVQQT